MAKKSLIAKQGRLEKIRAEYAKRGEKMPGVAKHYNRCRLCGRVSGFYRDFGVCRVCLRNYAREGMVMGLKKASW